MTAPDVFTTVFTIRPVSREIQKLVSICSAPPDLCRTMSAGLPSTVSVPSAVQRLSVQ
jgi:hypothetical protein